MSASALASASANDPTTARQSRASLDIGHLCHSLCVGFLVTILFKVDYVSS
jgi:hypothetical protein